MLLTHHVVQVGRRLHGPSMLLTLALFVDPFETIDAHHPFFMAIAITVTSASDGTQLLSLEEDVTVTPADGESGPNVYS